MAMEGCSTLPRGLELEPHDRMDFNVKPRTPLFGGVSYSLYREYNQHILSLAYRVNYVCVCVCVWEREREREGERKR